MIWDWRTGDVVPIIDTRAGVAVPSPTGHLVATTTRQAAPPYNGETVDVWDPATGRQVATLAGNTAVTRSLTDQECRQYLHLQHCP